MSEENDKKDMKIVWPEQTYVRCFDGEVREILDALGAKGAMVTDRSVIGHFEGLDHMDEEKFATRVRGASEKLGMELSCEDKIHDVARRLFQRRTS